VISIIGVDIKRKDYVLTIRNEHPVHFWEKKNNEQVER
jgi:hypothetical protein